MRENVCVTGIGVVSSIGSDINLFWNNLSKGMSGISKIESFDVSNMAAIYGGEIRAFQSQYYAERYGFNLMGRASQFAVVAASSAMCDSGFNTSNIDPSDLGTIVGTTMGECQAIEEIDSEWVTLGEDRVKKELILRYPGNVIAMNVSRSLGLKGISIVIPNACAAGNYAIAYGYDLVKSGRLRIALVGGADAFSRIAYVGFNRMFAMSPDVCRPFDRDRRGMLLGEGSGFLVLESLSSARKRGAKIYAEIVGYATSCDASHMTIPSVDGVARLMTRALKDCGLKPSQIDYISAHGTGTKMNDKTECDAMSRVFGADLKGIAVNSIKSMLGHTMGAASAIEAVNCCLSIRDGIIAPTINFSAHDTECDINCVPNKQIKKDVKVAMNNAFAFGGNNASTIYRKITD